MLVCIKVSRPVLGLVVEAVDSPDNLDLYPPDTCWCHKCYVANFALVVKETFHFIGEHFAAVECITAW